MDSKTFVAYTLDSVGIYPYPEFVKLFTDFFNNSVEKEQMDEVEKHIKATRSKSKIAKAYDHYQANYKSKEATMKKPNEALTHSNSEELKTVEETDEN